MSRFRRSERDFRADDLDEIYRGADSVAKKNRRGRPTKGRETTYKVSWDEPISAKGMFVSPSGKIVFIGHDGKPFTRPFASATVERTYNRDKGPKVLSRIVLPRNSSQLPDSDAALLQFDSIFGMDSNTRVINGQSVSIASLILGKWVRRGARPVFGYARTQAIEFRNLDCHPDLLALKQVLSRLPESKEFNAAGRIAIVIDSHLGNLEQIQARKSPIIDEFHLPAWASLVYASDVASDRICNLLIKAADGDSKLLLDQIENGDWHAESQESFFDHGSYYRIWD